MDKYWEFFFIRNNIENIPGKHIAANGVRKFMLYLNNQNILIWQKIRDQMIYQKFRDNLWEKKQGHAQVHCILYSGDSLE